jgi:WS/DGAT/MGAT family acyltransferase
VLLTAVAGALRRYMQANGTLEEAEADIRSFIPVNLRPIETGYQLGNRFGLVFLTMPISVADPLERLRLLRRNMDELKTSAEAIAAYSLLMIMGAVPYGLQQVAVSIFDAKGSAIMTNVPGPRVQLYLGGAPVDTVMAWVPQSGRIGLGVSIISYNGRVFVGVASDAGLVPDPERILAFFEEEFDLLLDLAEHPPAPPTVQARSREMSAVLADLERVLSDLDGVIEKRSPGG